MNGLLLDTNVVSEITTSPPDLNLQPESSRLRTNSAVYSGPETARR